MEDMEFVRKAVERAIEVQMAELEKALAEALAQGMEVVAHPSVDTSRLRIAGDKVLLCEWVPAGVIYLVDPHVLDLKAGLGQP
jgi:hypothetical protein